MNDVVVRNMLLEYRDMEGSKILSLLIQNNGDAIYASQLEIILNEGETAQEVSYRYHPTNIEMTDWQTLKEIGKRLNRLIQLKAEFLSVNPDKEDTPFDEEMAQLIRYRKETTRPGGGLKSFDNEDRIAYKRQNAAIRRLLNKAEKDGHHEAVAIVKRQLRQGKQMLWVCHPTS